MSVTSTLWLMIVGLFVVLGVFVVVWGRDRLGCGCVNDGRSSYPCPVCGYTRCAEHRYRSHNCNQERV